MKPFDKKLLEKIDKLDDIITWKQTDVKRQIKRLLNDKVSYISCCKCRKIIEYQSLHSEVTLKGWASICIKCLNDLERNNK